MSHLVQIQTEVRDPEAAAAACRRLGLPEPVLGTATLFEGEATGLIVKLRDWLYPVVVDTASAGSTTITSAAPGRPRPPRPLHAVLRRREGQAGSEEEGLFGQRGGPQRRQHPAPDRRVRLSQNPKVEIVRPAFDPRPSVPFPSHHSQPGGMPMPRIIEVTVSPRGETTVQTRGYAGGDCLAAASSWNRPSASRPPRPGPPSSIRARPTSRPCAVPVTPAPDPTRGAARCPTPTRRPGRRAVEAHRRGDPRRAGRRDRRLPRPPLRPRGRPARPRLPGRRPRSWRRTAFPATTRPCLSPASSCWSPRGGRGPRLGRPAGQDADRGEPGSPDDWMCFLVLSPRPQIESLLEPDPV